MRFSMDSVLLEEDAEAFVRVNERDCGIFKQWCWRK